MARPGLCRPVRNWLLLVSGLALVCSACGDAAAARTGRIPPGSIDRAPAGGGPLDALSCPNDVQCWAVGSTASDLRESRAVVEVHNPRGWALVSSPMAGTGSALHGVACIAAASCWAVGAYEDAGGVWPLIEHSAGSAWSLARPPASTTPGTVLTGIACVSESDCWAVGSAGTPSSGAVIEHFDGDTWTSVGPGSGSTGGDSLRAVSCRTAADCWTVGNTAGGHTLTEHYDGVDWSVAASPGTDAGTLMAVACPPGSDCWAVGTYARGAVHGTLIERHSAGGWAVVASPTAVFGGGSSLASVACRAANDCWAVGNSRGLTGVTQTLVELFNGSAWSVVAGPAVAAGASASLAGVTCPSYDDCWGVGGCSALTLAACRGSASFIELYDTLLPDGH